MRKHRTIARLALLFVALGVLPIAACTDMAGVRDRDIEIIWPRNNAVLYDIETLRARVRGYELDQYEMYWYVDDSRERRMYDDWWERPPHKVADVDTWDWTWRGRGPYTVGFIVEDRRGREVAHRTVRVYVR